MRKKVFSKLDVSIRYERKHSAYRIVIDGDVFWADTFEHAVVRLIYVLFRDEFLIRDCNVKRIHQMSVQGHLHDIIDDLPF